MAWLSFPLKQIGHLFYSRGDQMLDESFLLTQRMMAAPQRPSFAQKDTVRQNPAVSDGS